MNPTEDLIPVLKKLRLSGVLQTMDLRIRQAVDDSQSYEEFLYLLLSDETERRESTQLQVRLRRAQFEHDKTLEGFNYTFNPKIPKTKIVDFATCNFLRKKENILLIGPTGVGKSHIAQALGHRACRAGYTCVYTSAKKILTELRSSRADNTYDRKLLRYAKSDLLIIDDLGLRPLHQDEPEDLYEIIRLRYENGSLIVTSNRAVEEWAPLFGDALMASAAMDRLLHHSHIIEMQGHSYRNPPKLDSKTKAEQVIKSA